MNKMMETEKFTDSDWEKVVADLGNIDVDKAWSRVSSRMNDEIKRERTFSITHFSKNFIRVAASIIVLLGIVSLVLQQTGSLSRKIIIATTSDQKNIEVKLPDGSNVILNRNTTLTYRNNFGKKGRNVTLTGEAFFRVAGDASNPFIIDAGKAKVKVVGTSFNVITNNPDSAVEVFVETGRVMLSDNEGTQNIMLDPGFVGTLDSKISGKVMNNDPNYMAWNTEQLKYDGQQLEIVFRDLKKVFDADIVADESSILNETWTSPPIDKEPLDTIIQLICGSFNLGFTKDGDVYHLSKK